ncbi:MAG: oligoendopeptidase F [Trueperaceae bacterium]
MPQSAPIARSDVPENQRWDAASLFPTVQAWDDAFHALAARIPDARAYAGTLADGPDRLADWLELHEDLTAQLGLLHVWTALSSNVDANDAGAVERADRIRSLGAKLAEATAFALPELVAIGIPTLRAWIRDHPRLHDRDRWLDRIERDAPHLRSAEVEELLGALGGPFSGAPVTHSLLANAELEVAPARDAEGREHAVTQSVIDTLREHPDRELRQSAWTNYADAHLARKRTMASLLVTGARQTNLLARVRGYDDALAMTLGPLEVSRTVVDQLLRTFEANLDVWHRFYELKRRHLGLERLEGWDVAAPVCDAPPPVTYAQAVDWVCDAMRPLGDDYVRIMRHGATEDRWVDRAPNAGKRMGAFSSGHADSKPYIMMSWTEDLGSASTLAHELGHSMHSHLSREAQPYPYARYTLFAAEVASNLQQAMMRERLFAERAGDRAFELALIDETMVNFGRYFLIMPTLMRFELELHRRAAEDRDLSADALNELTADLFAEAYGPAVHVDRERVGSTWAQFHTHLYSRFYVFMYATGIGGAHAFARRLQDGGADEAEAYRAFLREGGRTPPIEAMRRAGVDLASPEPVQQAFDVLRRHVDRFEALIESAP